MSTAPPCASDAVTISAGPMYFGLGNVGLPLRFRNIGPTPCLLTGYPGVAGLDANGRQISQGVRTPSAYLGGLRPDTKTTPIVVIGTGDTASALLAGGDNPIGDATSCTSYVSLLVTPPDGTRSFPVTLDRAFPGCAGLLITPVVQGSTGSQW